MKKRIPKIIVIVSAGLIILGTGIWYVFFSPYFDYTEYLGVLPGKENKTEEMNIIIPEPNPVSGLFVYVCGEVNAPGVYELTEESRVYEAVEMAGGFTKYADSTYLNLARTVTDSERIYVPSIYETAKLSVENVLEGTGVVVQGEEEDRKKAEENAEKVNINTATSDELTTLPGIGEARAKDIISYRTNVGRFEKIEDIMNVSGIGEAMFSRIKSYITTR